MLKVYESGLEKIYKTESDIYLRFLSNTRKITEEEFENKLKLEDWKEIKEEPIINYVTTVSEASKEYNKDSSTLNRNIRNSSKFMEGINVKKSGDVWLILKSALDSYYDREVKHGPIDTLEKVITASEAEEIFDEVEKMQLQNLKNTDNFIKDVDYRNSSSVILFNKDVINNIYGSAKNKKTLEVN